MSGGVIASGQQQPRSSMPSAINQGTFAATGALSGACTLPIEVLWHRFTTRSFKGALNTVSITPVYRAAIRFWTFDLARSALASNRSTADLPVSLQGGLGGAAGGFSEVCTQALFRRAVPAPRELALQSGRLFLCFGSYTYLSTTLSERLPPKPFWKCWLLGAVAGGFGNSIIAAAEGVRIPQILRVALPKGALVIGTVISTQVTSCRALLEVVEP